MLDKIRNINIWVVAGLFLGIFLFVYFTGALTSGYHFIDDHSMVSISNSLATNSFVKTVSDYIKADLLIRFRPVFFIYYVSIVKAFGLDLFNMSLFVWLLAASTFSFFYLGLRGLRQSVFTSILFVFLIFSGSQMAVWWRLGVNETVAMFFLGLTFLFLAKCSLPKNYQINNVFFNVFLAISALSKESFLIAVPAFAFLKVWNEKVSYEITWWESLKKNWLLILPFGTMAAGLLIIKFYVGTNQIGYAGVTSSLHEFLSGIKHIILGQDALLSWTYLLGALAVALTISLLVKQKLHKTEIAKLVAEIAPYLIFSVVLVTPEILMYAKSGMVERYLLPSTLGLAFLVVGILLVIKDKAAKYFAVIFVCVFIVVSFMVSVTNAKLFAVDGRSAGYFFSTIQESVKPDARILLVVDPVDRFEVSDSIKTYLSYYGYNQLYAYSLPRANYTPFEVSLERAWKQWFVGRTLADLSGSPDLIVVFDKPQAQSFFEQSHISISDYTSLPMDSESYAIYLKKAK